jgi:hypothetical protein
MEVVMPSQKKDAWYDGAESDAVLKGGLLGTLPGEDSQRSEPANASESADHELDVMASRR